MFPVGFESFTKRICGTSEINGMFCNQYILQAFINLRKEEKRQLMTELVQQKFTGVSFANLLPRNSLASTVYTDHTPVNTFRVVSIGHELLFSLYTKLMNAWSMYCLQNIPNFSLISQIRLVKLSKPTGNTEFERGSLFLIPIHETYLVSPNTC